MWKSSFVQLDGAALPGTAQAVRDVEVQLGAVEGAVALVDDEGLAHVRDGFLQDVLVVLPLLHGADMVLGHGGELDLVLEAEGGVHLVEEPDHVLDLVLHLLGGHEDMGVVLGEAADPEQAVEGAGQLVPVHQAQLTAAQGQIPVGVGLTGVDQHAAGAVHGLYGEILFVDDGGVHVLLVVLPMAAALPQGPPQDDGRGDLHVPVALVDLPPVVDEGVAEHHALGQEEGEPGALAGASCSSQTPASRRRRRT